MKALILNSGMGSRMGVLTSEHPKCMTEISGRETILSRQLSQIADQGIEEVVMTTGRHDQVLTEYCKSLDLPLTYTFVKNPVYDKTNYIYSIYCAREALAEDDILLMHGDLVFENMVLDQVIESKESCMTVSTTLPLPEKDFKAVVHDNQIEKVGIEFFEDALAAQPLYHLKKEDWKIWLDRIVAFCEADQVKCYAENALNEVSDKCVIRPLDVKDQLCAEIDNPEDLKVVSEKLAEVENRTVYMSFSADMLHSGHISIIRKAARLGRLIIGVLCGAFNGFLIGFLHIPPMLVTLCGLQLYTGIAMIITTGPGITGVPQSYINIANGTIAGIPHTLPLFIIVTLVMSFLLKSTTYGQKVYFLGSNEVASKYSGINNFKVIMTTYMISGFLGAISGILTSSHYGSGKSNYNTSYTLLSLLIVVLGGVHPDGGKGKVIGVTLAIVLLQLISSAFSVLRIDTVITDLVYGLILIAVLVITNIAAKRATKVKTK